MYNKCYRELKTKKQKDSHLLNIKGKFDNILKDSINERFGLNVCLIGVSDKNCQTVVKFLNEVIKKMTKEVNTFFVYFLFFCFNSISIGINKSLQGISLSPFSIRVYKTF